MVLTVLQDEFELSIFMSAQGQERPFSPTPNVSTPE